MSTFDEIEEAFQLALDESLQPRGPESLFELVGSLGLAAGDLVVDVGCGRGEDTHALARRFGLRVVGVDPVQHDHTEGEVEFRRGTAERLPIEDASAGLVWCKEVLTFTDLPTAFAEFRRVPAAGRLRARVPGADRARHVRGRSA